MLIEQQDYRMTYFQNMRATHKIILKCILNKQDVDWINLPQNKVQWQDTVKQVMNTIYCSQW
jgi:hypothetical protein